MARGAWVLVAIVLATRGAAADGVAGAAVANTGNEPWSVAVTPEQQARANQLFAEANAKFAAGAQTGALELYRQALAVWRHPVIFFNMAVTLTRLERYLEAAAALDEATKYGSDPFAADSYKQVLEYVRIVNDKVGRISISCAQSGARVTLDGHPWFTCPGTQSQRVLPGEHTVYADLEGFMPSVRKLTVATNGTSTENLEMVSLGQAVETRRRMPVWVPYTVLVAGLAVTIGGGLAYVNGQNQMDQYDRQVAAMCQGNGCSAQELAPLQETKDSARRLDLVGKIGLGVGGVAVATGIALILLNRPEPHLRKVDVAIGHGRADVVARWEF